MSEAAWTPQRAANRLVKIAEAFNAVHGTTRFPIAVPPLALEAAKIFDWPDPISEVRAATIRGFEGALLPDEERKQWLLLYNQALSSPGRIRFTQAHELGHYILHRQLKESFECTDGDMLNWSKEERDFEGQADLFASYLLMPLDDFRQQVNATINLDLLGHCADRYGVSLTAAILKWLQYTEEKAVLVISTEGFMNWSCSSEPARDAGAFFRTKGNVIPVPNAAVATSQEVRNSRDGIEVPATVWFPHAEKACVLREMKIESEQYGNTLTLLILPRVARVWAPWSQERS